MSQSLMCGEEVVIFGFGGTLVNHKMLFEGNNYYDYSIFWVRISPGYLSIALLLRILTSGYLYLIDLSAHQFLYVTFCWVKFWST